MDRKKAVEVISAECITEGEDIKPENDSDSENSEGTEDDDAKTY